MVRMIKRETIFKEKSMAGKDSKLAVKSLGIPRKVAT